MCVFLKFAMHVVVVIKHTSFSKRHSVKSGHAFLTIYKISICQKIGIDIGIKV